MFAVFIYEKPYASVLLIILYPIYSSMILEIYMFILSALRSGKNVKLLVNKTYKQIKINSFTAMHKKDNSIFVSYQISITSLC